MKRILFILFTFFYCCQSFACTTFLVSGKYTADGRPLLYKHRDTGEPNNALQKFNDGKYEYIGLINATPKGGQSVWGGYNEKGFAIINSAAYTNNIGDTTKLKDFEGVVMKKALQCCATLKDFENLLDTLPKPLGVDANFGVIDAFGGAAYYETGNYRYVKFDANDSTLAPDGFLVRTNYSFSGDVDKGYGFIRYQTAYSVLTKAVLTNQLNPKYLINNISRNFTHSLTGENLEKQMPLSSQNDDFRFFIDYIPRVSSASSVLIVGTQAGESPEQTMMWSLVGFPLTVVATPVWLRKGLDLPKILTVGSDGHANICDEALRLKDKCFPIKRGSGGKYIKFSVVENQQGTGFLQKIRTFEDEVFQKTSILMENTKNIKEKDIHLFYDWLDQSVPAFYSELMKDN